MSEKIVKLQRLHSYRKRIASSRSCDISCSNCRKSLSEGSFLEPDAGDLRSDLEDQGVFVTDQGDQDFDVGLGEDGHVGMGQSVSCRNHTRVLKEVVPEFFMAEPSCSVADVTERVVFLLRKQKAERFLQMGMMMRNYKPKLLEEGMMCKIVGGEWVTGIGLWLGSLVADVGCGWGVSLRFMVVRSVAKVGL